MGPRDPRRDGGFTIFYIGINLGAFLAPLIAGTLGEKIGWHWGFGSAGVGMLFAVMWFVRGQYKLGSAGLPAGQDRLNRRDWMHIVLVSALMIPLVYAVISAGSALTPLWNQIGTELKVGIPLAAFIAFLAWQQRTCTREEWHRVLAIVIVGVFVIFFCNIRGRRDYFLSSSSKMMIMPNINPPSPLLNSIDLRETY